MIRRQKSYMKMYSCLRDLPQYEGRRNEIHENTTTEHDEKEWYSCKSNWLK